jgi:hypothetical protein
MKSRLILLMCALLPLLSAVQCSKAKPVPDELIGTWVSSDPRYADRPMELRKETIIFEHGEGYFDFKVYAVVNVEKKIEEYDTLYIITYEIPDGLKYKLSFYYTEDAGGTIRYKNQPEVVWTKKLS